MYNNLTKKIALFQVTVVVNYEIIFENAFCKKKKLLKLMGFYAFTNDIAFTWLSTMFHFTPCTGMCRTMTVFHIHSIWFLGHELVLQIEKFNGFVVQHWKKRHRMQKVGHFQFNSPFLSCTDHTFYSDFPFLLFIQTYH